MTIWERMENALGAIRAGGTAVSAGQKLVGSGAQLPDLFLVYFLVSSPPEQHADDRETMRSYLMQVSIYSRAGLTNLPDVDGAMVAAGFQRAGQRELPYNQATQHYGLALDYIFLEQE